MCCLNYEQSTYEDIRKRLPKVGSLVETERGKGEVVSNNLLKEKVAVKFKISKNEDVVEDFRIDNIKLISGGYEDDIEDSDIKLEIEDEADKKLVRDLFKGN